MGLLTLNTSSFDNFTVDEDDDVDEVFPRFLLSPTISILLYFSGDVGWVRHFWGTLLFENETVKFYHFFVLIFYLMYLMQAYKL